MATYKSKHTGERVDGAVDKIPENLPSEDSLIVVKADGSSSDYLSYSQVAGDKLDKQTVQTKTDQIYGKLEDGSQTMFNTTMEAEPTTIPRRDTAGRIQVADGVSGTDAVNFQQLDAIAKDINDLNIENGTGKDAIQQRQDGDGGTFDFTGKNPNATALDSTLTGQIPYGATGDFAASFGGKSAAIGKRSFACGTTTIAKGNYSFASGDNSVALGSDSHAEGYQTVTGPSAQASHAEGINTQALGLASHSEGSQSKSITDYSHAEGIATETLKTAPSSSGGSGSGESGTPGGSDWNPDTKMGLGAHVEGSYSKTLGYASHAEGLRTQALGHYSHSEGSWTVAKGKASHSEGEDTKAVGDYCHAEGLKTEANNNASHAEGYQTHANGNTSHAEGSNTWAIGQCSHAGGTYSSAGGRNSFAHGENVKTILDCQAVFGQYNLEDSNSLFIIGNGTSDYIGNRKNAFQVLVDGRAKVTGVPREDDDVVRLHELDDYVKYIGMYYGNKIAPTLYFGNGQTYISGSGLYVRDEPNHAEYRHNSILVGVGDDTWTLKFPNRAGTLALVSDVDAKYDKTGGTIGGDVIITGDLTVNGTQHINNTENLNVENAMIYSNATGATLATNGGIGIKTNNIDVYGIVYDPTSNSVKLGLGKSDANGRFTFNAGEGQPVAIRDDSTKFNDNHLVKWDADNNKLVDSGYLVGDFVDVATQQTISGIKTFVDEVHFNGITEHYGNVNITDYVLKILDTGKDLVTQYRSDGITIENGSGEAAVQYDVKFPIDNGTLLVDKFKYSKFSSDDEKDLWLLTDALKGIEMRCQDDVSYASMLVEKDYVEMSDVSETGSAKVNIASDTIFLASENTEGVHKLVSVTPEKVAVGNGADDYLLEIDSLSAKFSKRPQVKDNGNYVNVALVDDLNNYVASQSESADKYYAQITNENGIISARIFKNGEDDVQNLIISKDGVKVLGKSIANTEQLATKVDKLSSSLINQAYVRNANGEDTGLAYTYTDEGGTLAVRNASGQLQVSDPSQDKDATNKSYADNLTARYVSTSILGG